MPFVFQAGHKAHINGVRVHVHVLPSWVMLVQNQHLLTVRDDGNLYPAPSAAKDPTLESIPLRREKLLQEG